MQRPSITIHFNEHVPWYRPGDVLTGYYRLENVAADEAQSLEFSVLWHTEGKGDQDIGVHQFKRFSVAEGDYIDPRHPNRFSTQLPHSPLSYNGAIIKIHWCARVRLFLADGQELAQDRPFVLGNVGGTHELKPYVELQSTAGY